MTILAAASASNDAAPGALGFVVVFGLAVILVFVFRSMSKHIRKVNEEARQAETAAAKDAASASGAGRDSTPDVTETQERPAPRTGPASGRRRAG